MKNTKKFLLESAADAQKRLAEFGEIDEENGEEFKGQKRENWKKSNAGKKTKIKYKTLDEIVGDNNLNRYSGSLVGPGVQLQSGIKVNFKILSLKFKTKVVGN